MDPTSPALYPPISAIHGTIPTMHELSLATSIVESVSETLAGYPNTRVLEVRLRVGVLAAVEEESLQFCFGLATENTPVAGSRLVVHRLPVILYCSDCKQSFELPGLQSFRCPHCDGAQIEIRQGKEMEIDSLELEDEPQPSGSTAAKSTEEAQ